MDAEDKELDDYFFPAQTAKDDDAEFLERGRRKLLLEVENNRKKLEAMNECDRMVSPIGASFDNNAPIGERPKRRPIPKRLREKVLAKFGGKCAYCGCPLTLKTLQVDHIHSFYVYGDVQDLDALFPACRQCNYMKESQTVNGFRRHLMRMVATHHKQSASFRMLERYGFIDLTKPPIAFWFEKFIEGEELAQQRAFARMGLW